MMDQDWKVSLSVKLNTDSQPMLSLTCDKMEAPAAMAKTNKALCGAAQSTPTKGAVKPAAVIMATVAEPCNRRMTAAKRQITTREYLG